jgi:hypothetical protein
VKSVRTQLVVGLILGLGAMSALAGYGIFRSALEEANELFDYELRSVAISLPQSVADTELANRESGDFEGLQDDRVVIQIWDASNHLTYESLPSAKLPRQHAGFQSIEVGERHYRVFGLQQASRFVQVGQPMSVRDESALTQASRTLWPLLAIVPLEIALVLLVAGLALADVVEIGGDPQVLGAHALVLATQGRQFRLQLLLPGTGNGPCLAGPIVPAPRIGHGPWGRPLGPPRGGLVRGLVGRRGANGLGSGVVGMGGVAAHAD